MGKKSHQLIPSARRLISSLRDMGYDFPSAVADIVDNSIAAGATRISIDIRGDGDEPWVRICDDGRGMKPAEVREALRYGASRQYDEEKSLGKFGLGLKTASMSQCQHVLVASRSNPARQQIYACSWDLARVIESDAWEIVELGNEHDELLREPLMSHTGTVVLWLSLDRIIGSKHPYAGMIRRRIQSLCLELEEHLAMVFHRYLAGEGRQRRVKISVNGKALRTWDPFVRTEKNTVCLNPVVLEYDHDGIKGGVLIEPYVLPHQEAFSSAEAHAAAAGPLKWNRQQGFYIYRADRMIQSGGWSTLRTLDEHTKLARIAVSFDPRLDEAFRINVAKMRVQIPRQLREQITQAVAPVIKMAQAAYRKSPNMAAQPEQKKSRTKVVDDGENDAGKKLPVLRMVPNDLAPTPDPRRAPRLEQPWTYHQLKMELEGVATEPERRMLRQLFDRLLKSHAQFPDTGPAGVTQSPTATEILPTETARTRRLS